MLNCQIFSRLAFGIKDCSSKTRFISCIFRLLCITLGHYVREHIILAKSSYRPLTFCRFSSTPKSILQFYLHPHIGRCVSQLKHQKVWQNSEHYIQDAPMNTGTPIFKIHKIQHFITICQKSLSEISCFHEQNLFITQVPPFLKFTKFSILSQFVKNHFLKYPIFMSKTSLLLKHMTEETQFYRNEHYYSMTVVAMSQNVKTYPITQCKLLLILKMRVLVFIGASWV